MVAAGGIHAIAVTVNSEVYTWGCEFSGALGNKDEENKLVPTKLDRELSGGSVVVVVGVVADGALIACP